MITAYLPNFLHEKQIPWLFCKRYEIVLSKSELYNGPLNDEVNLLW